MKVGIKSKEDTNRPICWISDKVLTPEAFGKKDNKSEISTMVFKNYDSIMWEDYKKTKQGIKEHIRGITVYFDTAELVIDDGNETIIGSVEDFTTHFKNTPYIQADEYTIMQGINSVKITIKCEDY